MNTELKNAVKVTDSKAQYDTSAKRLLGQKSILAHILVKTVDEFKGMNPKDVVDCIEGTPHISTVPVEPGLTNAASKKNGERLVGFNTENEEINEGLVRFDIVFYVRMKDGLSQIIINVEAQKDEPTGYEILNRAIFYVSRLISSQKERDFENSSYDDIKRVYSIWVCMNMEESSMSHVHLTKEDLIGSYQWKGNLDLLNIIMLGLAKNLPEHDETYELHRLLGALLSQELTIDEKLNIIGNEYDIPIEENFRKDVSVMCNLSQGIEEKGIAIG
uniref:PD-(D/E)XK nuclease family transposase n=1 Tax=Roseburia intestinalis TaxID=166486 RepID=UPI00189D4504